MKQELVPSIAPRMFWRLLKQPTKENPVDIQQIIQEFFEYIDEGDHFTRGVLINPFQSKIKSKLRKNYLP